ncbi:N-acetyltransferase [Sphingopyxis sp.]|uniref:GNAT family N-acetyltransferase n=1 Tax=Sphingopyxis sp. TaxID=1908224 RepID=UPI0025F9548B|nr:N-acetyltransferase [Sphingopyxis sp.]MBR2171815.1 GNAT family N-acetyltransferase [Sphingopyxis sp.]
MAKISIGKPEDKVRFLHTLVLGFSGDPMARWASPDAATYLDRRLEFFDAFGGAAFEHESAFVADDGAAVATWLPPGVEPDGALMAAIMDDQTPGSRKGEMDALFEQMERFHLKEPHWYLPLIAADPAYRGRGLGTALMEAAIARIDADGRPAYLESSNPRNIPLYQRFGFEIIGAIQAGTSPVLTPMLRPGRA